MPEEKYDGQERARRAREATPPEASDAQIVREENARRFRAESERLQAERAAQEQYQRDRQAMHEQLARQEDDAIRAKIFARYLQAEEAKARAQAEAPPAPLSPPRPSAELALEQEAGRRALLKHRGERAASAETGKDSIPAISGFKVE
jgi:hypothetical protein